MGPHLALSCMRGSRLWLQNKSERGREERGGRGHRPVWYCLEVESNEADTLVWLHDFKKLLLRLCHSQRFISKALHPLQVKMRSVWVSGKRRQTTKGRSITHLLSYPMHHDWAAQPCFHTLTMRVKACTHGCLWATSVTSLSTHTLGLKQKQRWKYLVSKCFTDLQTAAGQFMKAVGCAAAMIDGRSLQGLPACAEM